MNPDPSPIATLLNTIKAALAEYDRPTGGRPHQRGQARTLVESFRELLAVLDLQAYPISDDPVHDDRLELVVVTVHGVEVSIRGRGDAHGGALRGDVFVHVDTSARDDDVAERYPLVLEVNNGGESTYR
jgi:hypothetical protein